ncbi:hypothetical protein [Streptomyces brasiliensis]|uniref:Uncharacterized protein n=1 Tax=Streptomyces brasiliensis TaxID=1954 RepID=A0A917NZ96_9ACTN|nr:hypothetical protein [Streptomyces brasiliensis]GGJ43807.1 hypothetical protein GCM10010121_063820 [Streptomyces brasiliensis]
MREGDRHVPQLRRYGDPFGRGDLRDARHRPAGLDWSTIETAEDLPVPIDAGATKKHTWTVCVDSWRVPLGMHIETQDVKVTWK